MNIFPVRCKGDEVLKYIFPSKQEGVHRAIEKAREILGINCLIVFGSAVTYDCGIGSDIDFAVDAPEITDEEDFLKLIKPLRKVIGGKADLLHLNSIKNDILINEITEKGVKVYESRIQ